MSAHQLQKNVLIYAIIRCGHANVGTTLHIKLVTQDGSNKHFEKYLCMYTNL